MICWVDIETTCLDEDAIEAFPLEISVVITDDQLNPLENRTFVMYYDYDTCLTLYGHLNDNVVKMHNGNGLFDDCRNAKVTARDVDHLLAEWFDSLGYDPGTIPLGGSTISFDRAWMQRYFPQFHSRLHYRNIDVSTIKELTRRWTPRIHQLYLDTKPEIKAHRSLDDIMESLRELRLYKREMFDYFASERLEVDHDG